MCARFPSMCAVASFICLRLCRALQCLHRSLEGGDWLHEIGAERRARLARSRAGPAIASGRGRSGGELVVEYPASTPTTKSRETGRVMERRLAVWPLPQMSCQTPGRGPHALICELRHDSASTKYEIAAEVPVTRLPPHKTTNDSTCTNTAMSTAY